MSSAAAKAFNSWRAILAPARVAFSSVATASAPTKKKAKEPRAKYPPMVVRPRLGLYPFLLKPRRISPALANFVGASNDSVINANLSIFLYVNSRKLENPENELEFICDEKLKALFDGRDVVKHHEVSKLLSRHFV